MNKERLEFLAKLKIESEAEDVPIVTDENAKFLHFLARMKKAKDVLELGTANGYSGIWLADALEEFDGTLVTIDHSPVSRDWALKNFETAGSKNVESLLGRAQNIMPTLNKKFDLIFVDAIKKSYPELWKLCKPLMKEDTVVIFDDVLKFPEKTKEFHELMATETDYEQSLVPIDSDDGVLLVQKKKF